MNEKYKRISMSTQLFKIHVDDDDDDAKFEQNPILPI